MNGVSIFGELLLVSVESAELDRPRYWHCIRQLHIGTQMFGLFFVFEPLAKCHFDVVPMTPKPSVFFPDSCCLECCVRACVGDREELFTQLCCLRKKSPFVLCDCHCSLVCCFLASSWSIEKEIQFLFHYFPGWQHSQSAQPQVYN